MSARERARNIVAALVDAYNRKDLEDTARLCAEGIRLWSPLSGAHHGREQVLEGVRALFDQLPDDRVTTDTIVTNGTTAVVELTSRGTAPSGRPYTMSLTSVIELDGDLVAGVRTYLDPDDLAGAIAG
jgi:ketosteroid isomerase-like protein